jgi:hypothetical protein
MFFSVQDKNAQSHFGKNKWTSKSFKILTHFCLKRLEGKHNRYTEMSQLLKLFCFMSCQQAHVSRAKLLYQEKGGGEHGLINYTDTKAKCRHLKNITSYGLCGRCSSVWGPLPSYELIPTPLHTVYVYTVYLFTQRWGGGRELTRENVWGATFHKAWSKISTWLTVSPVYKLI